MIGYVLLITSLVFAGLVMFTVISDWWEQRQTGPWLHENATCRCRHDYYDHAHWRPHAPCTALMCSCETWTPTKENKNA